MDKATWIALGAVALALVMFGFSLFVAVRARNKKAANQLVQPDQPHR